MSEVSKNSLLQEIQMAVGCYYMSDLHASDFQWSEQKKALVLEIPVERYTLKEWNEAVSYIKNEIYCFQTVEEAKKKIIAKK